MTAKQYLRQGCRLKELIKTNRDELAQLRSMLGSISGPSYDKIGGGSQKWNGDTAETNLVIRCVDLEKQIEREMVQMITLMQSIHTTIEDVRNPDERLRAALPLYTITKLGGHGGAYELLPQQRRSSACTERHCRVLLYQRNICSNKKMVCFGLKWTVLVRTTCDTIYDVEARARGQHLEAVLLSCVRAATPYFSL